MSNPNQPNPDELDQEEPMFYLPMIYLGPDTDDADTEEILLGFIDESPLELE